VEMTDYVKVNIKPKRMPMLKNCYVIGLRIFVIFKRGESDCIVSISHNKLRFLNCKKNRIYTVIANAIK
jgi:hypothetical protein